MAIIAIVGAGMMGTAMSWPLSDNKHQVRLVGTPLDEEVILSIKNNRFHPKLQRNVPDGVEAYFYQDLASALEGADGIISGVSSFGIEWFAQTVGSLIAPGVSVLSVTKGLEDQPNGDLFILPDVLNGSMPLYKAGKISFNAIGGPCIAHELAARRQTAVVFTGTNPEILESFKKLLSTTYYHVWISTDVVGVETCAAMKNAYAMGVGMAVGMMEQNGPDGLANLYNPQAALFGQSCYEMSKLVNIIGGSPANVSWLPGAGDLFVTVFGGRTVSLGKLLGKGIPFSQAREILAGVTLESVEIITRVCRALPKLEERGLASVKDFPFLLHMGDIVLNDRPVNIPWDKFFHQL
ncbi:MAG: glycerol-3-phosphate dehydrogenase [Chloroflexota bacterium]